MWWASLGFGTYITFEDSVLTTYHVTWGAAYSEWGSEKRSFVFCCSSQIFFCINFFFLLCLKIVFLCIGFYYLFIFLPHLEACRILVPLPGIETMPPTVKAQSSSHRTTREVPQEKILVAGPGSGTSHCAILAIRPGWIRKCVWSLWRLLMEENL